MSISPISAAHYYLMQSQWKYNGSAASTCVRSTSETDSGPAVGNGDEFEVHPCTSWTLDDTCLAVVGMLASLCAIFRFISIILLIILGFSAMFVHELCCSHFIERTPSVRSDTFEWLLYCALLLLYTYR